MSNDEYKSVEHRVLANPSHEPRISIAVFFNAGDREALYGPFSELISPEKPARYRQFNYNDYMKRFFTKELDGKTLTNYYRV
ncbi:Oxoglutarate/iron-dependent dioxygenase [Corchorus olitorius]|uniref:Oxoglutarate/iron-dependent dioxygenase n=1 Tax=Corchorus olitorius TaxID=93759 RepID=A0A1R3JGN4_9ROSI|nr:Oxoglutarate/iron-dependent dioxygenase [Corchorus olitorius]